MDRIADRYEVVGELGRGGTATVYEARDRVLHRPCAVKLLTDVGQGAAGQSRRERLQTEAMALATLDHPRVVRVFDLGEHEGLPFLAMELVKGGSLADRLLADGPLRPAEAVDRLVEVLEALQAAHHAGIVHRDVKPHNVLLRADGTAALADFGIARQEASSHTKTGVALGSLDYMAPEQRIDARRAGPPADLYGAGCTLYHLLTADTPVDLYLSPDHSPRWEGVPVPLRGIIRRATAVDPGDRYATAEAMSHALSTCRESVKALPPRQAIAALHGTPPAHAVTRVEVVATQERPGRAGAEEYAWANQGPRVGRGALITGIALTTVVAVTAFLARPVIDSFDRGEARADVVRVTAPLGSWQGTFGGRHPGTLAFHGSDPLTADLVVDLDGHELRAHLVGSFDPVTAALELQGARGGLVGQVDRRGLITGDLRIDGAQPLEFVLVGSLRE